MTQSFTKIFEAFKHDQNHFENCNISAFFNFNALLIVLKWGS